MLQWTNLFEVPQICKWSFVRMSSKIELPMTAYSRSNPHRFDPLASSYDPGATAMLYPQGAMPKLVLSLSLVHRLPHEIILLSLTTHWMKPSLSNIGNSNRVDFCHVFFRFWLLKSQPPSVTAGDVPSNAILSWFCSLIELNRASVRSTWAQLCHSSCDCFWINLCLWFNSI